MWISGLLSPFGIHLIPALLLTASATHWVWHSPHWVSSLQTLPAVGWNHMQIQGSFPQNEDLDRWIHIKAAFACCNYHQCWYICATCIIAKVGCNSRWQLAFSVTSVTFCFFCAFGLIYIYIIDNWGALFSEEAIFCNTFPSLVCVWCPFLSGLIKIHVFFPQKCSLRFLFTHDVRSKC